MQQEPRAAGFGVWVVCENANEGSLLPAVRKKRRSDVIAMQRSNPPNRLRFGVFEADPRIGELTKHGKRLPLQEQPFQLLAMLLERPGELVSREELRAKI